MFIGVCKMCGIGYYRSSHDNGMSYGMRLKEIKLAGFKSFVDPTTVVLPGSRVAVVGPNGCGKSNIIDAVRWVMGESSARQLRGEALTDVIFNGSNARQPTSLASVELLFDNREEGVGGKFASYAELAIRREVDRNSQSIYYLNGTRCRRRDIADVFLGTGFGPRSYSIIEQGMITDLVAAKPDELRGYLEEAAGVSKYRERRRETQNRIRHTEENLQRLGDIRAELESQLARLKKQAKAAERYQALKEDERQRTAELHLIRLAAVDARLAGQDQVVRSSEVALDKARSERQALETALERCRDVRTQRTDEHSRAQGNQFQVNAQAGELEQAIRSDRERIEELGQELADLSGRRERIGGQLAEHIAAIATTKKKIEAQEIVLAEHRAESDRAAKTVDDLESRANAKQRDWDDFNKRANRNDSEIRVCANRIEQGERATQQLRARLAKLTEQQPALVDDGIDEVAHDVDAARAEVATLATEIDAKGRALTNVRQQIDALEHEVAELRGAAVQERRRLAAIEALQQAALGRDGEDADVDQWIDAHGVRAESRLGETLTVDDGWESAVEMVLGADVQAIVVPAVAAFADRLNGLASGRLMLLDATASNSNGSGKLPPLANFVRGNMGSLAAGVFAAQSAAEALAHQANLQPGESIVTRDGLWLGADWLRLHRTSDMSEESVGAIRGTRELAARRAAADDADIRLNEGERRLTEARLRAATLDGERESSQRRHATAAAALAKLQTDYELQRLRIQEATTQAQRIAAERQEIHAQIERETEQLRTSRSQLADLRTRSATLQAQEQQLRRNRERSLSELTEARRLARETNDIYQRSRQQNTTWQADLAVTEASRDRFLEQREELDSRTARGRAASAEIEAKLPAKEASHQARLEEAHALEQVLRDLRSQIDAIDGEVEELTANRANVERAVEEIRSKREEARLEHARLTAKRDNERSQFAEIGLSEQDVRNGLPADAAEEQWLEALARIERRIERLGRINLAAIDEYETQRERKQYLDRQNEDLETALATLQNAIQRIDRDTRVRFKATFEQINENLKALFPKVFGGGRAALVLTSDDWLETGVALTAQPPGKRNAIIQLLSGGEKAMTAVALIFSIFKLNPSPVCLLDEVDAPLDDNNVQRFAELIHEMSQDVQFVVITHNKQTIEMADHLLGVTMQEAGVSRLVAVDVDQAARMAAAG